MNEFGGLGSLPEESLPVELPDLSGIASILKFKKRKKKEKKRSSTGPCTLPWDGNMTEENESN